jgi:glycosyltransferase involved in cell wall biosynthesis
MENNLVKKLVTVSVVIITRNEEETIGSSIQSVINAARYASDFLKSYEIILVDSNSTDRTVEIASRFPITILQLKERYDKGPSTGRYVGDGYASGRYVFFLDGDIILPESWLLNTVLYMNQNPNVAGVSGPYTLYLEDEFKPTIKSMKAGTNSNVYGLSEKYLCNAVLYRKNVLERVGSFDPWIRGEEERELGFRIRRATFELHELNILPFMHVIKKRKTSLMHGVRYSQGIGQLIRTYGRTALAIDLLRQYLFRFSLLIWMILNSTIIFLSYLRIIPSLCWLTVLFINVLAFGIMIKVEHDPKKATKKLCRSILHSFSILFGLIIGKPRKAGLPDDAMKLLKKGNVLPMSPIRYQITRNGEKRRAHSMG